jgi:hypothetical protein
MARVIFASLAGPEEGDPEVGDMDNYYKSPSPQELRYRDVLAAIAALGPVAKELAEELDQAVWQVVNRAVDAAIADHDRRVLGSIIDTRAQTTADSRPNSDS